MSKVEAKRNDIAVQLSGALSINRARSWSGATVRCIISHTERRLVRTGVGVISSVSADGKSAQVYYNTATQDLSTGGTYKQEWEVTFADGAVITCPSRGHNILIINDDLA